MYENKLYDPEWPADPTEFIVNWLCADDTSIEDIEGCIPHGENASDPKALFERQAEAYRDLFGALASHVGELAEITSKCCAGLVHEASRAAAGQDDESAAVKRSENDGTAASKTSAAKK